MIAYIPAALCAALTIGLTRSGLPAFLFLVPAGFMAYGYNAPSAWASAGLAVLGNGLLALMLRQSLPDSAYFALMTAIFAWIAAPPAGLNKVFRIALPYRFILGSLAGAVLFLLVMEAGQGGFDGFLKTQGELLSSLYVASAGSDEVQRTLREQYVTPERVAEVLKLAMLRGGGFVSCLLMFFISRQLSAALARLIRRVPMPDQISRFRVFPWLIWGLSFSLGGILLSSAAGIAFLEIPAWNALAVCAVLYLAQGWGIIRHFLARPETPPGMRLGLNVLMLVLLFSPGINIAALALAVLLGIAEHWVPLRNLKS